MLPNAIRRLSGLAVAVAVLAGVAAPVAQADQSSRKIRNACSGDYHRLCPREKPDSPEMRYCMEAKGRLLSTRCVRALEDEGIVPRGYLKD